MSVVDSTHQRTC